MRYTPGLPGMVSKAVSITLTPSMAGMLSGALTILPVDNCVENGKDARCRLIVNNAAHEQRQKDKICLTCCFFDIFL
jgi:hypothetical protein